MSRDLKNRHRRSSRCAASITRAVSVMAVGALAAVVMKELHKPVGDRTWTGTLGGVPYDLRVPTPERLHAKLWPLSTLGSSPRTSGVSAGRSTSDAWSTS